MKGRQQDLDPQTPQSSHGDGTPELAHGALERGARDAAGNAAGRSADLPLTLNQLQASAYLGVSDTTFRQLCRAGLLDACRSPIPNRWSRIALEAWSIHGYVPSNLHLRKVG